MISFVRNIISKMNKKPISIEELEERKKDLEKMLENLKWLESIIKKQV